MQRVFFSLGFNFEFIDFFIQASLELLNCFICNRIKLLTHILGINLVQYLVYQRFRIFYLFVFISFLYFGFFPLIFRLFIHSFEFSIKLLSSRKSHPLSEIFPHLSVPLFFVLLKGRFPRLLLLSFWLGFIINSLNNESLFFLAIQVD